MEVNKTGVILEEVRDMFKTLAEGQKIIEDDVKEIKVKVGNIEKRVDGIEIKVGIIETKVESIDTRLTRVETDVKTIKEYVMAVDDTLNDHEKRIGH